MRSAPDLMPLQFSLAAVLRVQQSLENHERLRLESLHARQAALLHEFEQTREARARLHSSMRQRLQQALTMSSEVQFLAAAGEGLERRQQQLQVALQKLRDEVAAQTQRYREQRRKREILESVRDARASEYRMQQQRREQSALDELHLLRRNRRQT
jgi:flagellar export protein FliJ